MSVPSRIMRPAFGAEIGVIALGGAIGASLRFAMTLAVRASEVHFAFGASGVNVIGSLLLGLLIGHLESGRAHPLLHPFLTIGVFGSFTTFSALALDNRTLAIEAGEIWAIAHLAGSIVVGVAAFALGNLIALRFETEATNE